MSRITRHHFMLIVPPHGRPRTQRASVGSAGFRPFVSRRLAELGNGGAAAMEGPPAAEAEPGPHAPEGSGREAVREHDVLRVAPGRIHIARTVPAEVAGERLAGLAVMPDAATCDDCLAELFDPADRRHRYPFISCANCGPRFTIIRCAPYDRAATMMAGFPMCPYCRQEYDEPGNRRFRAPSIACPACGPRLRLVDGARLGAGRHNVDAIRAAVEALAAGEIVALKGLGGFHLLCRADDGAAVRLLRARKRRVEAPLAVMVADLAAARRLVKLTPSDEVLLKAPERPILLAVRRGDAPIADDVARGTPDLGVTLPDTPVHQLIAADLGVPLVITSGNRSGEPVAFRDAEALERLEGIADRFLLHDRPIQVRADDSVVRSTAPLGEPAALMVRRARGYAPRSLPLPGSTPIPILACGAEHRSTFCLARGQRAWLGPHLGDLAHYPTLEAFEEGLRHFEGLFAIRPGAIACDMHPTYLSTAYARRRDDLRRVVVQHHHAHLAACLAEYGEEGPAVGAIFDGGGYGEDGTIWGGELLLGGIGGFHRVGHLCAVTMPGADLAAPQPWRAACAWLAAATGAVPAVPPALAGRVDRALWQEVAERSVVGRGVPTGTSVAWLIDAVAALCGLPPEMSWEGQAALALEALAARADGDDRGRYALPISTEGRPPASLLGATIVLEAGEAIRAIVHDLARGVAPAVVSARFHRGLARATAVACAELALRHGVSTVVLSGAVFENRLLLGMAVESLRRLGLTVRVPRKVPVNDGGIAFGQAVVAARLLANEAIRGDVALG